jgi:type I thyroxine 5'-deiodinase
VLVYIKEAHPGDEWQMDSNVESEVVFDQPQTFEARTELARTFVDRMSVETETFVDDIRNTAMACYAAWPERIYVIDREGRVIYKGGMGPFYFKPDELREFLLTMKQG